MLSFFRYFFERRRIRKTFGKLGMSSKTIDELLKTPTNTRQDLRKAEIQFICLAIRGDEPTIVSERITKISDIATKHEAMIEILSGILVLSFGQWFRRACDGSESAKLCQELESQFSEDIRMIRGNATAYVGNFGGASSQRFGFFSPNFLDVLAQLAATPYGQTREYSRK